MFTRILFSKTGLRFLNDSGCRSFPRNCSFSETETEGGQEETERPRACLRVREAGEPGEAFLFSDPEEPWNFGSRRAWCESRPCRRLWGRPQARDATGCPGPHLGTGSGGPLEAYLCGLAEGVREGLAWCLYAAAPSTELLPCLLPIRTPSRTVEVTRAHIQACPVYRGPGFVCLVRGREP